MTEFEQFAAERSEMLTEHDETLRPVVEESLQQFGEDGWYDPIINAAETMFAAVYADEDGPVGEFDEALAQFNDELGEALDQTTVPTDPIDPKVDLITNWVSTFTHNSAVFAAAPDDDKLVWVSSRDPEVRGTHRVADGQVRTVGDAFEVGGAQLRFPGDSSLGAPASEWANCRCIALPERRRTMGTEFAVEDEIEDIDVESLPEGEPPQEDWQPTRWHGVLAPEGMPSGDGRTFGVDSITARDLPLPLRWVRSDMGHHDGAVVVGNITNIWRDGGFIKGEGEFRTDSPEADEVIGMIATDMLRGVSVDLDDVEFEVDGIEDVGPLSEVPVTLTKGRISAATLVDIPAFSQAMISLGPWEEGESDSWALVAACLPCERAAMLAMDAPDDPDDETPTPKVAVGDRVTWGDDMVGTVQSIDGTTVTVVPDDTEIPEQVLITEVEKVEEPENASDSVETLANQTEQFAPGTRDGPGWLTNPRDTQRLRTYWTKGAGAAKIRWSTPGDFNRCRAQLAKYVNPLYLAGTCANLHREATGVWPGEEGPGRHSSDTEAFHLVASAATTLPAEAFANPNFTGPTAITVTPEGRVRGHLATWSVCHLAVDKVCTTAPTSQTNYAYFATGAVLTEQGEIPVGQITMTTGHADMSVSARETAAHYDHTGAAVADVAVGEDEHGIWVAGMLRDGLTDAQIRELRGAALSGDWRRIRGNLELVAALAVNVPGFPIPRTALAASAGTQISLVAAGVVQPEVVPLEGVNIRDEVRAALAEIETERATAAALAHARATLRSVRVADARAALRN